jgi:hypothetical protein
MIKILLVAAHGENWEIADSRAVTDVIRQFLTEPNPAKEQLQENGTFELHYTPSNGLHRSFSIPLTTPDDYHLNQQGEGKKHQHSNEKKNDQNQPKVNSDETLHSRL